MKCRLHVCEMVPAIIKHGSNLRFLDLRDFGSPFSEKCSMLTGKEIEDISTCCPNLIELAVEVVC